MGADIVDDLHAAEDMAGMAVAVLAILMDATPPADPASDAGHALSQARTVLRVWDSYCRPSCNPNDDGPHDEVCEEGATCGCPCRSRT